MPKADDGAHTSQDGNRAKRLRGNRVSLLSAVLATVMVSGCGVFGGADVDTHLSRAWKVGPAESDAQRSLRGVYILNGTLVRVSAAGATAYSLTDGSVQWRSQPPAGFTRICRVSSTHVGGVAGIVFGTESGCGLAATIDLATGEIGMIYGPGAGNLTGAVSMAGGRMYTGTAAGIIAHNTSTASRVWVSGSMASEGCTPYQLSSHDGALFAVLHCRSGGGFVLTALDAGTGQVRWSSPIDVDRTGSPVPSIVNTAPLVLHLPAGKGDGALRVYDAATGSTRATIPSDNDAGTLQLVRTYARGLRVHLFVISGGTLVATTLDDGLTDDEHVGSIVGIDLTTGERVWEHELDKEWTRIVNTSGTDGVAFFSYNHEYVGGGTNAMLDVVLHTLDPADGSVTPQATIDMELPDPTGNKPVLHVTGDMLIRLSTSVASEDRARVVTYRPST